MRFASTCAALLLTTAVSLGAQGDPKTAMLEQAGWEALKAGQASVAAAAFRQALEREPKNARLHLGAGTAAFVERRFEDARAAAERALAFSPNLLDARLLLGQALRRTGDLHGAIREYDIIVHNAPDDAEAREVLERWRREADLHGRMNLALGDHFTVSFEGPQESGIATDALASLDRAYWRIAEVLGTYPPSTVSVVLYSTEQFRDITRSPPWAGGVYDGIIRVPVRGAAANPKEFERVLAHEFVHAFVHSIAPHGVPTWLNEGLASALESESLDWADARLAKAAAAPPLAALDKSFGRLSDDQAQVAYATSAIAVQRLLQDAGGAAVTNLLRDIAEGVPFESAFTHRIQRSLADFEASLRSQ